MGEDSDMSQPATVDLSQFIVGHSPSFMEEIALTGGAPLAARKQKLRWATADSEDVWSLEESGQQGAEVQAGGLAYDESPTESGDGDEFVVTIAPMEIKTLRLTFCDWTGQYTALSSM